MAEIRRLQGKAMPTQAGVDTVSTVRRVTYGKKDVQTVDNSFPLVKTPSLESEAAMMAPLDCSIPLDIPGSYDQSLPMNSPPPQMQLPSGFGVLDDTTPSFSRNVSDFGWCSNGFEGLDDFDPLDMNLLDALFDSDVAPSC